MGKKPGSSCEVINENIWNRFICIDKMSINRDDMIKLEFLKTGNVVPCAKIYFRFNVYVQRFAWPEQNFF